MGQDPSEIRREIEETRLRMGDTVEALGYKANVPERVKDAVQDRVDTVKGTIGDVVEGMKSTVSGASVRVGNALGNARDAAQTTMQSTGDRMSDTLTSARENAGTLRDRMPSIDMPSMSGETVRSVARRVGMAAENPLGLALGGLALGILAGLLVPVTDFEREKVGPLRDDLLDRAQAIGGDAVEHGKAMLKEATQTAIDTAQQAAREHAGQVLDAGLDTQTLASTVVEHGKAVLTETAQAVAQTAQQSAQQHGKDMLAEATGKQQHDEYGVLLDDGLSPGSPGTASP